VDELLEGLDEDDLIGIAAEIDETEDVLDIANKAPIIKLMNTIMFEAQKNRASDIHLQPFADRLQVRYRIDGILYDTKVIPKKIQDALVSRVKVMGKMDIAERRLPQDGRTSLKVGDGDLDVRITRARALGTCFGVRDAIDAALSPEISIDLTIVGQLVHNPQTVQRLHDAGVKMVSSSDDEITTRNVMITAHGAPASLKKQLSDQGHIVYDATCPLVLRVHQAVRRLVKEGWHPVVIGQREHVEVKGIVGDLVDFTVIGDLDDLHLLEGRERIGVVCQTTYRIRQAKEILLQIGQRFPDIDIEFIDTVCKPTKDRQNAVDELSEQVDVMIVVGGTNSSNTHKLLNVCREKEVPAYHVENDEQLEPGWFVGVEHVGITAGTSTPHDVIDQIHARLVQISRQQ
jgi:4-hydroxy-3-methylbut-2-enyl diphosphate reductase